MEPSFVVGLDLGTTHCVLAFAPLDAQEEGAKAIRVMPVPQLVGPSRLKARALLPSFIYMPGAHEVAEGALKLPWDSKGDYAIGEFARERGSEVPHRLVSSAKSWLCHSGVDRTSSLLPWDAPGDVHRISPVEASGLLLRHLRDAWNHVMARDASEQRLEHQEIYLTVPASFDAVARDLTVRAAEDAGFQRVTLLEEPQAAFYAWLDAQEDTWRHSVRPGDLVLVCDVGGGTTDFSLIEVAEDRGELTLRRVAVGDHILLGGDNMDLALSYAVRKKLRSQGKKIDSWQFRALWHECRRAKEKLLAKPELRAEPLSLLGRGSSLIGGTIRTELTREDLERVLLDGFFPPCSLEDSPRAEKRVGVREMGLPYAQDPAVTRHLAAFLRKHLSTRLGDELAKGRGPTAILFNGGVMKSQLLKERLLSILGSWFPTAPPRVLDAGSLDLAVARGASYYGLARHGNGIRIRAGAARSYYIAVEASMPSVPGIPTPVRALCVLPFGTEEGTTLTIQGRDFGLVVGEEAVFSLMASNTRKGDEVGEIVEDVTEEIHDVVVMSTQLSVEKDQNRGSIVPVGLESVFNEVGTLEIWCVEKRGNGRWRLAFDLRAEEKE